MKNMKEGYIFVSYLIVKADKAKAFLKCTKF